MLRSLGLLNARAWRVDVSSLNRCFHLAQSRPATTFNIHHSEGANKHRPEFIITSYQGLTAFRGCVRGMTNTVQLAALSDIRVVLRAIGFYLNISHLRANLRLETSIIVQSRSPVTIASFWQTHETISLANFLQEEALPVIGKYIRRISVDGLTASTLIKDISRRRGLTQKTRWLEEYHRLRSSLTNIEERLAAESLTWAILGELFWLLNHIIYLHESPSGLIVQRPSSPLYHTSRLLLVAVWHLLSADTSALTTQTPGDLLALQRLQLFHAVYVARIAPKVLQPHAPHAAAEIVLHIGAHIVRLAQALHSPAWLVEVKLFRVLLDTAPLLWNAPPTIQWATNKLGQLRKALDDGQNSTSSAGPSEPFSAGRHKWNRLEVPLLADALLADLGFSAAAAPPWVSVERLCAMDPDVVI